MKYRLIKKYPDSFIEKLDLGCIAEPCIDYSGYFIYSKNAQYHIDSNDIENWPEFWQPIKEPLFVTEDNKEIFDKSQIVFLVNPNSLVGTAIQAGHWDKTRLVFSTIEAGEKYINENKPVFSKKQINEAIGECDNHNEMILVKEFLMNLGL